MTSSDNFPPTGAQLSVSTTNSDALIPLQSSVGSFVLVHLHASGTGSLCITRHPQFFYAVLSRLALHVVNFKGQRLWQGNLFTVAEGPSVQNEEQVFISNWWQTQFILRGSVSQVLKWMTLDIFWRDELAQKNVWSGFVVDWICAKVVKISFPWLKVQLYPQWQVLLIRQTLFGPYAAEIMYFSCKLGGKGGQVHRRNFVSDC